MKKARPCAVVSPDQINRFLRTVVVAPLTTNVRSPSFRPSVRFQGVTGQVAIDQVRVVDRSRCLRRLGQLSEGEGRAVADALIELFAHEPRS